MIKIPKSPISLDFGNVQTTIKLIFKKCNVQYTLGQLESLEKMILKRLRPKDNKVVNTTILDMLSDMCM